MPTTKYAVMKQIVFAVALAVAGSRAALADDGGMGRFSDSYAYFNNNVTTDKSPSEWRQAHPNGLSERQLQSYSSEGSAWSPSAPVFSAAASDPTFKQTHPNGLTEREFQALSSEAPEWQLPASRATSVASRAPATAAQTSPPKTFAARLSSFFNASRDAPLDSGPVDAN